MFLYDIHMQNIVSAWTYGVAYVYRQASKQASKQAAHSSYIKIKHLLEIEEQQMPFCIFTATSEFCIKKCNMLLLHDQMI
jgi:hypothetical protein